MLIYVHNLRTFLNWFDFNCEKIQNDFRDPENDEEGMVYRLIDNQDANLGGIDNERFCYVWHIVDRLDAYYNDYIVRTLEEDYNVDVSGSYEDILKRIEHDDNLMTYKSLLYYITHPNELSEEPVIEGETIEAEI